MKYKVSELVEYLKEEVLEYDDELGGYRVASLPVIAMPADISMPDPVPDYVEINKFNITKYILSVIIDYIGGESNISYRLAHDYVIGEDYLIISSDTNCNYPIYNLNKVIISKDKNLQCDNLNTTIFYINDIVFGFRIVYELLNRTTITLIQRDKLIKRIKKYDCSAEEGSMCFNLKESLLEAVENKRTD